MSIVQSGIGIVPVPDYTTSIDPNLNLSSINRMTAILVSLKLELTKLGHVVDNPHYRQIQTIDGYELELTVSKTYFGRIRITYHANNERKKGHSEPRNGFNIATVARKISQYIGIHKAELEKRKNRKIQLAKTEEVLKLLREEFTNERIRVLNDYSGPGITIKVNGLSEDQARSILNFIDHELIYNETEQHV